MIPNTKSNSADDLAKLRRSPHAMASWQNARQYLNTGRHAPARASFDRLVQEFPGISNLWVDLGTAAAGNLDFQAAGHALQQAEQLVMNDAPLLFAIGTQYYHLRRLDQALACFQRAVATDPSSIQLRLALAAWLERYRRVDDALECVDVCLRQRPNDGHVLYFKAFLLHRKGRNGEAETALRDLLKRGSLLPADVQADANHLLGIVLDAAEQYAEALTCLNQAKWLRSRMANTAAIEAAGEKGNQERRELLAKLTPEMLQRWRNEPDTNACQHPLALLAGAMRSGTTLMEQILGAHPEVLVFDESMISLKELLGPLQQPMSGRSLNVKMLNDLAPAVRGQMTSRYFKSLLRETAEPEGSLLLDKNPSTTAWLHVWLRLFPQSKIVIALRDPRDIIISCYFQNFAQDWAKVSFASLEKTAKFYSDCMDVWLRLRELGGFDWIETRYEDVVANLEGEGRRVTNFLGLPWHEKQATYYETARAKFVHSPTYGEVTKPVYSKAVKRWEHYAEAMAPLQARLEPYFKAFGYC